MGVYYAKDYLTYRIVEPKPYLPNFANLTVRRLNGGDAGDFAGPGIYGVFHDDELFYVGLYAGNQHAPFGGTVFDRWARHIICHIVRAPDLRFARSSWVTILNEPNSATCNALAACLPQGWNANNLPHDHRLFVSPNCTLNKVRFVDKHPELLSQKPSELIEHFSFVYVQWPREAENWLDPAAPVPSRWVKAHWLASIETKLITELRPICNAQTPSGEERTDVDTAEFEKILTTAMKNKVAELAAARGVLPGVAPQEDPALIEPDEQDEEELNEEAFADRVFVSGYNQGYDLTNNLRMNCPPEWDVYCTATPDIRIALTQPIDGTSVLLTLSPNMRGKTEASREECKALGITVLNVTRERLCTKFQFDPGRHGPDHLFKLARETMKRIIDRHQQRGER